VRSPSGESVRMRPSGSRQGDESMPCHQTTDGRLGSAMLHSDSRSSSKNA
jgi:hypothetical protein